MCYKGSVRESCVSVHDTPVAIELRGDGIKSRMFGRLQLRRTKGKTMKISLSIILGIVATLLIASSCATKTTPTEPTPDPSTWEVLSRDTATTTPANLGVMTASMHFKNASTKERKFMFRHTLVESSFGHIPQLCFGDLCIDLTVFDPSLADPFPIAPGGTDEAKMQVVTNGAPGTTTVRIVIFDVDNPADTIVYQARMTATP